MYMCMCIYIHIYIDIYIYICVCLDMKHHLSYDMIRSTLDSSCVAFWHLSKAARLKICPPPGSALSVAANLCGQKKDIDALGNLVLYDLYSFIRLCI